MTLNYAPPFDIPTSQRILLSDRAAGQVTIPGYLIGKPANSAKYLRYTMTRALTFPANFAGSAAAAAATATASTTMDIQKNGVSCGTITFALGAAVATFVSSGGAAVSFAAGDILGIVAQASQDATLADIAVSLVANPTV